MNKLSFRSIGSESAETVQLLVIVLSWMLLIKALYFGLLNQTYNISSTEEIFIQSVCELIIFISMIVIWSKIKESVGDMTLGKRIKYFIYCSIFGTAFTLLGYKLAFFSLISIIVLIVGFVFYCLIISRCIKEGDEHVKKFGKLLILGLVVLIMLGLSWQHSVLESTERTIGKFLFLIYLQIFYYPYFYFCKTLKANKEYKGTWWIGTFAESLWWWIIPLCVLGAILLMSRIG